MKLLQLNHGLVFCTDLQSKFSLFVLKKGLLFSSPKKRQKYGNILMDKHGFKKSLRIHVLYPSETKLMG